MAVSQFTIYSSTDGSAPSLTGEANSLNTVLRAILVDGYGAKAAAGWDEPVATSGNCAGFRNVDGSSCVVHVNDNGPNGTSTYKEARITGWETLSTVGTVGTGTGQFPTPAQSLTTGFVAVRKSTAASAVARSWLCFADAYTFYFFALTGDAANTYFGFGFGDLYAYSANDTKNCVIYGRNAENSGTATNDRFGNMFIGWSAATEEGQWAARPWGGVGTSTWVYKLGVFGVQTHQVSAYPQYISGAIAAAYNGPDNTLRMSPIYIGEQGQVRGEMRGIYQVCHPGSSFSNGQVLTGAGDYAGKTFQIVKWVAAYNSATESFFAVETSNTVPTNTYA